MNNFFKIRSYFGTYLHGGGDQEGKILHIVIQHFPRNLMHESQMGAVNAIYSYTLVAIL